MFLSFEFSNIFVHVMTVHDFLVVNVLGIFGSHVFFGLKQTFFVICLFSDENA